jgi:hypothetical protein
MAIANTKAVVTSIQDPLNNLSKTDWYFHFIETQDLYLCDQSTLDAAISEAPTPAAAGYVFGIQESRLRAQNLTM